MGLDYIACEFCGNIYPEDTITWANLGDYGEPGYCEPYCRIPVCRDCGDDRDNTSNYADEKDVPEPYTVNPCDDSCCECEGYGCSEFKLTESGKRKLEERIERELKKWQRKKIALGKKKSDLKVKSRENSSPRSLCYD